MPDPSAFRFEPERLERFFASLQPVDDSVQSTDATAAGCCSRTRLTLRCRAVERGYALSLPLQTKLPNESPGMPPQNRHFQVMRTAVPPPMLQVLSAHEGKEVAEIAVSGEGAAQCPPGNPNRVRVEGVNGGEQDVPFTQWSWKAPAVIDGALMDKGAEEIIKLFHPFKAPDLPAQLWSLSVPGCPAAKLKATVAAFPDVRWQGRLTIQVEPRKGGGGGFEMKPDGAITCSYNGHQMKVADWLQGRVLCQWLECLDMLAKSAVAVLALKPGAKHTGFDNPRLENHGEFRWSPWPRLSLKVESSLFEQKGNGLLGHALSVLVAGDPLVGAQGEISLLPTWLENRARRKILSPLLADLEAQRSEEITHELGLWLVAEGQVSMRAAVSARRPEALTEARATARGRVDFRVEGRSVREFETIIVRAGATAHLSVPPGIEAQCESPPESPVPEPLEKKCKALVSFTGVAVSDIEKWLPGCRLRRWLPAGEDAPPPVALVPGRSWPAGGEPGKPVEIPWCD